MAMTGYGVGTYNLNGGLLTGGVPAALVPTGLEIVGVGGTGIFNQSAGTNNSNGGLYVGGPGSRASGMVVTALQPRLWNLHAQRRDVDSRDALAGRMWRRRGRGGTGIFTQTGGTNIAPEFPLAARLKCSSA